MTDGSLSTWRLYTHTQAYIAFEFTQFKFRYISCGNGCPFTGVTWYYTEQEVGIQLKRIVQTLDSNGNIIDVLLMDVINKHL